MTIRLVLPVLATLALAGCQADDRGDVLNKQNAETNAMVENATDANAAGENALAGNATTENVAAKVVAMNDTQRNMVFIRAILDAGLPCEHVASSQRLPDQDGNPLWRANCQGGASHMITITPDGTAKIVSRTDR